MAKQTQPSSIEIRDSAAVKSALAALALGGATLLLFSLFGSAAAESDPLPYFAAKLALAAYLFALFGRFGAQAWGARKGQSVTALRQAGFSCPNRFGGDIRWRDAARFELGLGDAILFARLRPEAADGLQWRGFEGALRRILRLQRRAIAVSLGKESPSRAAFTRIVATRLDSEAETPLSATERAWALALAWPEAFPLAALLIAMLASGPWSLAIKVSGGGLVVLAALAVFIGARDAKPSLPRFDVKALADIVSRFRLPQTRLPHIDLTALRDALKERRPVAFGAAASVALGLTLYAGYALGTRTHVRPEVAEMRDASEPVIDYVIPKKVKTVPIRAAEAEAQ